MSTAARSCKIFSHRNILAGVLCCLSAALIPCQASGESFISFVPADGGLPLAHKSRVAPLYIDPADWPGVARAARDLQADFERVTGIPPAIRDGAAAKTSTPMAIIIGTLGRSSLLDTLVKAGKLNVQSIAGRWEAFHIGVVEQPLPGVARALVIAGSDKRGTIYGIYELSRQIGVSPWYWWADVPVQRRENIFVQADARLTDAPAVQYRGIFINDEAPALTGWVQEKFGRFDHAFYEHVFELMLRLRANYLWPAMWRPRAFIDDDPRNAELADEYGIVMGTTHHEPVMRAHDEWGRYGKGPWNYAKNPEVLRAFWKGGVERVRDYETIISLGMRGDGDEPMSEQENVALLERVVADQRKILGAIPGRGAAGAPQLWALYKEVQGYYERGMRVPDDVILLWCDDNWGNIRRLPTPEEQKRPGGAGVYYHFDYVGGPRNYKWLNTIPISKIQEQMNLAWHYRAKRIWIVNVGDIKPMEFPIEFFLSMAWDPERMPYERLEEYSSDWAERQFGAEHAAEIAALINGYTKLNGRRKPELLAPDTFSPVHYRESERVLAEWRELVVRAERVNKLLPQKYRDAYFQLVLYPVKASANIHELYMATGLNKLYVAQGRAAAGTQAARVRKLFAEDGALVDAYHALGGGKWNHMMDQIKLGYTWWQQPDIETMPAVSEVRPQKAAAMGVAIEGSATAWPSYNASQAVLPALDNYTHAGTRGTRWIEIFNRGGKAFQYRARTEQPWIQLQPAAGTVEQMLRMEVNVNWDETPVGETNATITIESAAGETLQVLLPLRRLIGPVSGFMESNGYIAIEAPHFDRATGKGDIRWQVLPDFGRTFGGVTVLPVTAPEQIPKSNAPRLEYDLHFFSAGEVTVEVHTAPSLDFQPGAGLRYAVSLDDERPKIIRLGNTPTEKIWETSVADGISRLRSSHRIEKPGRHVLKLWMVSPGVVFERILIDTGGLRPGYLGPPESFRASH
jgi:hypothetical protein